MGLWQTSESDWQLVFLSGNVQLDDKDFYRGRCALKRPENGARLASVVEQSRSRVLSSHIVGSMRTEKFTLPVRLFSRPREMMSWTNSRRLVCV